MTDQSLIYIFGPPLVALAFAGAIALTGNLRTKKLDAEIADYRARKAAERAAIAAAEAAVERAQAAEVADAPRPDPVPDAAVARGEFVTEADVLERLVRQISSGDQATSAQPDIIITSDGRTIVVQRKSQDTTGAQARRIALAKRFKRFKRVVPRAFPVGLPGYDPARSPIRH